MIKWDSIHRSLDGIILFLVIIVKDPVEIKNALVRVTALTRAIVKTLPDQERGINVNIVAQPMEVKTVIDSEDTARELGKWDAEHGLKCNADAYHFAGTQWELPHWRSTYTGSYVKAKGL